MQLIDDQNAVDYLRERRLIEDDEQVRVRELLGGVSNLVLYVERPDHEDFVVKQARAQLRVEEPWFCSVDRIEREVAVLQVCQAVVPETSDASVPQLLFDDPENHLYAMSAVPKHETWKQRLLGGETDTDKATASGRLLGTLHASTWRGKRIPRLLEDRTFFEDLRIDPYYRHVARVHPDLKPTIDEVIDSVYAHQLCLVHGDFSPKNLLVHQGGMVLVDFEVGHLGDPAFDLGFLLTHLVLKSLHVRSRHAEYVRLIDCFWKCYSTTLRVIASPDDFESLDRRAAQNLAACMLARIDGKSKVEYLSETNRNTVRTLARNMLTDVPCSIPDAMLQIRNTIDNLEENCESD